MQCTHKRSFVVLHFALPLASHSSLDAKGQDQESRSLADAGTTC